MKLLLLAALLSASHVFALPTAEIERIGRRVWENECGGTREGLTSWNTGENFASLGIGHFIWYPKGIDGPFEESFPKLAASLESRGEKVAAWMRGDCPWASREAFLAEAKGARMMELRDLLARTVPAQAEFLAQRMRAALPKMLDAAPAAQRAKVKANFEALAAGGPGTFALIDYVNFKGEGTNPKERYDGEGWGLLQVLAGMDAGEDASPAHRFSQSAERVLEHRVKKSPPARGEQRWLAGWRNRVRSYAK